MTGEALQKEKNICIELGFPLYGNASVDDDDGHEMHEQDSVKAKIALIEGKYLYRYTQCTLFIQY